MNENVSTSISTFGGVLRRERVAVGLSATALAARMRLTQSYISQLENGALQPPEDHRIREIAAVLGCRASILFIAAGRIDPDAYSSAFEAYRKDPDGAARLFKESATHGAAAILTGIERKPSEKLPQPSEEHAPPVRSSKRVAE